MSFDYELIDCGHGRKLERFGEVILTRPEVLANKTPKLSQKRWRELSHAEFVQTTETKGVWAFYKKLPSNWEITFRSGKTKWRASLFTGDFKHVGVFPEQELHWKFLSKYVSKGDRVLNLFGYTGCASLSAAAVGGDVFHVDSSRSIVKKASENAQISGIDSIHWVVEDALSFAEKEVKRKKTYRFIIMDPPIYGRGKRGEHWRLETLLPKLLVTSGRLLDKKGMLILNTYSPKIRLDRMVIEAEKAQLKCIKKGVLQLSNSNQVINLSNYILCRRA